MKLGTENSAWITKVLDPEARRKLDGVLAEILPGTPTKRRVFLDLVEEEIDAYRKLTVPYIVESKMSDIRLRAFANAAEVFAKSLAALKKIDLRRIRDELFMEARRLDRSDVDEVAAKQLMQAGADLDKLVAAGFLARTAAHRILNRADVAKRHRSSKIETTPATYFRAAPDELKLVKQIVEAYARVFRKRPSSASMGVFAKSLREIFDAVSIPCDFGEKRLRAVINLSSVRDVPVPKRGPKLRASQ